MRKKLDYREHFREYMKLVDQAYDAETRAELKGINRQLRRTYGRGHEVPACWVFPPDTKQLNRLCYASIGLGLASILISVAVIILKTAAG